MSQKVLRYQSVLNSRVAAVHYLKRLKDGHCNGATIEAIQEVTQFIKDCFFQV